jgi:hypothetical protein
MAVKKYSGEKAIIEKIQSLFAYRKMTDLMQRTKLNKDVSFRNKLTDLQYRIYLLDAYLEGQWDLDPGHLKTYWQGITGALAAFDYSTKQIKSQLAEIRLYEQIETNTRLNKWPTKVPFKEFYTTKSCDVRLLRHLIYRSHPELNDVWNENSWTYYDLITEINDDIADVTEDLLTYNGNRFLISILRKGEKKTSAQYRTYIEKVTTKAQSYFKKHRGVGENMQLLDWTLSRAVETLKLLDTTLESNDPDAYLSSLLLVKMK